MPEQLIFPSRSEEETSSFGRRLGATLKSGLTIALNGQLGSGKTHLVRAVCEGLGIHDELVNSPTFVLMQTYTSGRFPVFHFDTCRLGDVDEFLAIGAEEYLNDAGVVCLVEWAQLVSEILPQDHLAIRIAQTGATTREIGLHSHGPVADEVVVQLRRDSAMTD